MDAFRSWKRRIVFHGVAVLVVAWAISFYPSTTFSDDGWRLVVALGQALTVEVTTSACACIYRPSVVESPTESNHRLLTPDPS